MDILIYIVCLLVVCSFVYKICMCILRIEPVIDNSPELSYMGYI